MNDVPTTVGHRMVLAIMDLADDQTADLAESYEASVSMSEVSWEQLAHVRQKLWEALIRRAQRGEIAMRGVLDPVAGAVWISSDALLGSRPDFLADTLTAAGSTFHAVQIFGATAVTRINASVPAQAPSTRKGKGGATAVYDWDEFVRELTRALFAGELISRRDIKKHMTNWCSTNWQKQPDETSIRNTLRRLLHGDIPP